MHSANSDQFQLTAFILMQIACWPIERVGEKGQQDIVWLTDEEYKGRKGNCVRLMRFQPLRMLF